MSEVQDRAILIVDDEGPVRRLMASVLSDEGFMVLEAENVKRARDLVRRYGSAIRLAVIDMVMPGASGLDLAAELGRERPSSKILYISGHVSSLAMESILNQHPELVLFKPFTPEQLAEKVTGLLADTVDAASTGL